MVQPRVDFARSLLGSIAVVAALAVSGCGGEHVSPSNPLRPVTGKVTLAAAGTLTGMRIVFMPNGDGARLATGDLKEDGSFALLTEGQGDGVAEGKYKVKFERIPTAPPAKKGAPTIPSPYLDEDFSGFTAEIKPDTTSVGPYELKPKSVGASKRDRD